MTNAVQVKEQVNLPLGKCMELVTSGIQYRLFRAAITVTIISLAVAFLMVMLSQSLIARQVGRAVDERTAPRRLFDKWVSRLAAPITEAELTADMASVTGPGDPRWQEFKTWGKIPDDAHMQTLHDIALQQTDCQDNFFDKLSEGRRRQFVGSASGPGIFAYLAEGDHLQQFQIRLKDSDRKLPIAFDKFQTLVQQWAQTTGERQQIIQGHRAALEHVKSLLGEQQAVDALARADGKLLNSLKELGFQMTDDQLVQVRREANLAVDARKITDLLKVPLVKQEVADRANIPLSQADTDAFYSQLNSDSGANWLAKLSASKEFAAAAEALKVKPLEFVPGSTPDPSAQKYPKSAVPVKDANGKVTKDAQGNDLTRMELTPEGQAMYQKDLAPVIQANAQRIREVVKSHLDRQELADIEAAVAQSGGSTGFSNRTVWLIIVSFLVCVVGIANAMLMSVTERFREIATMKCLGATDNFIMINFILESIMQGVAGGIVGSILGFLLGSLRAWASYGNMAWQNFPLGQVLATAGVAMVVGVVVSALAAMYPAYVAARLAPMEAMRIE
jgi:hypothetical protein